ncbi:MAG: DUF4384 domain-containing protein [Deltaproteobacteria bacterium]|nr:DUF4384 domain-containing protein [Deltaproteobacteria bacterium]MBW2649441.1 DUF4384 domain-containing protein [Deltaproteobacteria bacterium]
MKKRIFIFFVFLPLLFLISAGIVCAADPQAEAMAPDLETRSVIQSVDVYAYPGEGEKAKQIRGKMLSRARGRILERAKKYLDSRTKIAGVNLEYQIIENKAGRFVDILKVEDRGADNKGRYHARIQGEVKYRLKGLTYGDDRLRAVLMKHAAPLTVDVWTDKREYGEGERVKIFFRGNRDFYGKIVRVGAKGKVFQLLPNNYRQISFFKRGKTYTIPDEGDRFDLEVHPPFGVERIIIYASDLPLSLRNMKTVAKGIYAYRGKESSLGKSVRKSISIPGDGAAEFCESVRKIKKVFK